jgi:hypothetical protein
MNTRALIFSYQNHHISTYVYTYLAFGGEVFEEQLLIGQVVLDRIAKYLLLPGLDLDINIMGKVLLCIQSYSVIILYYTINASVAR